MSASTEIDHGQPEGRSASVIILRRFAQIFILFLTQGVILLVCAGRLDWVMAWVYLGLNFWSMVVISLVVGIRNPGLIAERSRVKADAKIWDRLLVNIISTLGQGVMLAVAGLDQRLGWSPTGMWGLHLVGLATVGVGLSLVSWAIFSNKFFSAVVRIQKDREHMVVSGGPYQFVRHPGYVGLILFAVGTPLLLGSLWALMPGAVSAGLIVYRTMLEDKTLMAELEGYGDYASRVAYRLVPGVW